MANRILPGYMMPNGAKYDLIVDHDGPSSYAGGASGGETINASDFGLGGIETIEIPMLSNDSLTSAIATLTGQSISTGNIGNAVTQAKIRYFVVATGAEVANAVDLSAKSFRLQIRGV